MATEFLGQLAKDTVCKAFWIERQKHAAGPLHVRGTLVAARKRALVRSISVDL